MIKRLNKKGQGFTSGQLLALILGAVAVIIVIIGFTAGWDFFTDLFGQGDIDMTVISQKCNTLASTSNSGYCTDRIEIGKNKYINCEYAVNELGAEVSKEVICPEDNGNMRYQKASKQICQKIMLSEGDNYDPTKVEVNGKTCETWGVNKE